MMRRQSGAALLTLLLLPLSSAACAAEAPAGEFLPTTGREVVAGDESPTIDVRPGIEVLLSDSLHLLSGHRVGLITNHTGIDRAGRSSIDLLAEAPGLSLVALYAPEHGIRGAADPGEAIDSSVDEGTGLPIHSLYGSTRKPTPEMLEGIDLLLFDIQDVGARFYTYSYTMALAMEAAGETGIPFVVLDRPEIDGGTRIEGNILDPAFSSFIGMYPIPVRHGMTVGELARLFRDSFGIPVELHVVPADGWRRGVPFEETGLPWIPPSPNIPTPESARHYPGTCFFEGSNLSVGRGSDAPFRQIGAPWLDASALLSRLEALGLPGVRFEEVRFTPVAPGDGKYAGEEVAGIRWIETGESGYDATLTGAAVLVEARRVAGDRWEWLVSHFDLLAGGTELREWVERQAALDAPPSWEELGRSWKEERRHFEEELRPAALLPAYAPR